MPDIAMCLGTECPIRNNCYRYRAWPTWYEGEDGKKEYRQSYMDFRMNADGTCDDYWSIEEQHPGSLRPVKEIEREPLDQM